jgi:hypothetical protein
MATVAAAYSFIEVYARSRVAAEFRGAWCHRPRSRVAQSPERYDAADRALFPELERIMTNDKKSLSAAARDLAEDGRVAGAGTPESRAKRLAALYKRERNRPADR